MLKTQAGFILVAAIFLMLVVALLLTFLLRTGAENQWSSSLRLQEARAFQAASSGLEWGVYQLNGGVCPTSPTILNLNEADLNGFTVTLRCNQNNYTEEGKVISIFELDALATLGNYGTSADFISRHLQLTVEGP